MTQFRDGSIYFFGYLLIRKCTRKRLLKCIALGDRVRLFRHLYELSFLLVITYRYFFKSITALRVYKLELYFQHPKFDFRFRRCTRCNILNTIRPSPGNLNFYTTQVVYNERTVYMWYMSRVKLHTQHTYQGTT